ncbi:serine hydrolase [Fictibacillus iocasae]|uniref:Serine hydrolase n=1 Tax=Fictibacillus iocasae TaxID=2715437 RepID=A0ABW2NWE9_9BACL
MRLKKELHQLASSFNGSASVQIQFTDWSMEINPNKKMKSASLIKLAILLEGYSLIEQGELTSGEILPINPEMMTGGAGIISRLSVSRPFSVQDMLTLMIAVSDNTAANVLIDLLGMDRINERCRQIGCVNTQLQRKMMDLSSPHENWISSRDTVLLMRKIYEHPLHQDMIPVLSGQQFRHKLPALMNPQLFVANKTGELSGVEHDAAIIMKEGGEPVYAAVLLTDFTDSDEALLLHRKIGKLLSQYMMNNLSGQ